MLTCRIRILAKSFADFVLVTILAAVLTLALLSLTGCMSQPYDTATGKPIGGPVGRYDRHPTTAPSGAPVGERPTRDIDVDRAAKEGGQLLETVLPAPWGLLANLALAAAAGAYGTHRLKRKPQPQ